MFQTLAAFVIGAVLTTSPQQVNDRIIIEGDTLEIDYPLPLGNNRAGYSLPDEIFTYFNCARGYYCTWRIEKDSLLLVRIDYCSDALQPEILPNDINQFGSWVSQNIIIGYGEKIKYVDGGWLRTKEERIEIEKGLVVGNKIYDNSNTTLSPYTENTKHLTDFLRKNIDWKIVQLVPKKDLNYTSVFNLQVDKDGRIAEIHMKRSSNPVLEREALRVIRMVPQWSVYYKLGKMLNVDWMLPINFAKLMDGSK